MKIFLKWFLGLTFILGGIAILKENAGTGFFIFLTGIFIIPPTFQALEKSNLRISTPAKYVIVVITFLIAVTLQTDDDQQKPPAFATAQSSSPTGTDNSSMILVGEVLHTTYFDIVVNKASITERINTGNIYTNPKEDRYTKFLVLNVTFKNTDTESRMIFDGSVIININGKEYNYDKSEVILADGWGVFLDQINPLTSQTTKLVYRIPTDISGPAYYEPARNFGSERIFLGDL